MFPIFDNDISRHDMEKRIVPHFFRNFFTIIRYLFVIHVNSMIGSIIPSYINSTLIIARNKI